MSIVSLKSNNEDFSFIINKNPKTGLVAKNLRKGVIFGFYTKDDEQSFNIYFKDGSDEVSFPQYEGEEFEYLNATRYNSATFVSNAIDEIFRSAFMSDEYENLGEQSKDEGGSESSFFINMIYIKNSRYIKSFEDYFPDFKINAEVVSGKNYKITITTNKSIFELLNFASLFSIFQAIVNDEPMFINEENASKYVRCMNILKAPYFVRYLFKIRFLENMKLFKNVKEELSKFEGNDIDMKFGNTWQARQMVIEEKLDFKGNILEIGTGEGKYITRFNKYMKGFKYFAIDIDEEILEETKSKIKNKGLNNVEFFKSTEEFINSGNNEGKFEVILTEVIEHMSIEEAGELIQLVIDNVAFNKLIITTPNADFNKNYFMEGFRHHDHKFEHSRKEFEYFINEIISGYEFVETDFFDIGDIVDGDTPTQAVVLIQ